MPHQCLNCGKVFDEGSSELLKGCSECNGNRFFFTKKPLNEEERKEMLAKVGNEIDEAINKINNEKNEAPKTPETINVEDSGTYKIDLKGLLEDEPIIIQKDGTYIIHLPSIFKTLKEKK